MASMVLWQRTLANRETVVAAWHKNEGQRFQYSVEHLGPPDPISRISPQMRPTRYYGSGLNATRAAQRMADKLERKEKAT